MGITISKSAVTEENNSGKVGIHEDLIQLELPVSSDAQIEKDNVQTLNSTINELNKKLQSNVEEKDKLLKKLKEVVSKYKQLQTHARALKEKLEEQEKISKSNDEALNLAGKFGTNLVEEKEQLNEQVKQLKDIVRSNAEELRKSRSKEEKYEDLLKEVEQKNSTLSEANVEVETKLHQMREEIQSLKVK